MFMICQRAKNVSNIESKYSVSQVMQYKEQRRKYVKFTRAKGIAFHDFGKLKRKQMYSLKMVNRG